MKLARLKTPAARLAADHLLTTHFFWWFDAYIQESGAVRDHGVKFRVKPENLRRLYDKSERL